MFSLFRDVGFHQVGQTFTWISSYHGNVASQSITNAHDSAGVEGYDGLMGGAYIHIFIFLNVCITFTFV